MIDIKQRATLPYSLLLMILLIGALGVTNVYSAARATFPNYWMAQIVWFTLSIIIAFSTLLIDYRIVERFAYPFYGFVNVLLFLVLVHGLKRYGARRWLDLGVGSLQPSELMKIGIVLILAKYFSEEKKDEGYTIRDLIQPLNISRPIVALLALAVMWARNAWLQDPIGELARRAYETFHDRPPEWEGTYLVRVILVTAIVIYFAVGALFYQRSNQEQNPFDENEKWHRLVHLIVWLGIPFLTSGLLYFTWQSEFLGDPIAVILQWLVQQGSPNGAHHLFSTVLWFRILLLFSVLVYLALALQLQLKKDPREISSWIAPFDLVLIPMVLIMAEPDLGTALLVGAVAFSMILFVGMRWSSVILMAVSGVGLGYISWFALLKDYQKRRVLTFLDPETDALGAGYHANQSIIAVGSGRMWGKGFAQGTQTQLSFLPQQHTDFAFSVWSEERGFMGCMILIFLYLVLIVLAVGIAAQARDKLGALLVTGFTSLVFWQAFVNIGMVIGVLPIVGVPLPLFSYGGSSLLTVMLGLGVTMNVAYRRYSF